MLRHLPFYDLLAAHPDRQGPEWTEGTAALLLLRLFDDWIGSPTVDTLREGGIPHLRHLISKIANPEVRRLLDNALMVLRKVHPSDSSFAAGPLLAYAQYLDEAQGYTLATDVLATVLEMLSLHDPADFRLAATTYERLGQVFTHQVHLAEAAHSYDQMRICAELCSDQTLLLRNAVCRGTVQFAGGNLEAAELLLGASIEQARKERNHRVEAWGRRVRACTLISGARYHDALHDLRQAWALAPDSIEQMWIAGDVAACMMHLGHMDIARSMHQHLVQTAPRIEARIFAHTNLLEIAVVEGDKAAFHAHWKALNIRKPLEVALYSELYYAQGVERWQGYSMAVPLYTAVAERAKTIGAQGLARQALSHL